MLVKKISVWKFLVWLSCFSIIVLLFIVWVIINLCLIGLWEWFWVCMLILIRLWLNKMLSCFKVVDWVVEKKVNWVFSGVVCLMFLIIVWVLLCKRLLVLLIINVVKLFNLRLWVFSRWRICFGVFMMILGCFFFNCFVWWCRLVFLVVEWILSFSKVVYFCIIWVVCRVNFCDGLRIRIWVFCFFIILGNSG